MTIAALLLGIFAGLAAEAFLPGTWSTLIKLICAIAFGLVVMIGLTYLTGGSLS